MRIFASAILIVASGAGAQTGRMAGEGAGKAAMTGALLPECAVAGGTGSSTRAVSDDTKKNGGFDLANLDRSVSPCADFYHFAIGGWMKNNPIPAAYPRWGSFTILQEHNQDVLRTILEDAAKDKSVQPGSNWQKIGDFYATCMDESAIESVGVKPLAPEFERIAQIKDAASLQAEVARLQNEGVDVIFNFGSQTDFKDSNSMLAGIGQGGLGLPDRDYYTREDEKSKQLRDEYVQHVTNMFKLLDDDNTTAAAEAKTVMEIETRLAKVSMPRVDLRDPDKVYHKMPVAQFQELAPNVDWEGYFKEIGAPPVSQINVFQPDFMKEVSAAWTSVPFADWKVYLRWQFVHAEATALPNKFVDENFDFYSKKLTGTTEILPRWRRCVRATDQKLGEDLGRFYVQRAFPPEAKAKAMEMVHNLIDALRADLSTLDWMSPATREQAIAKLSAIKLKIGYPDKWRDYSGYKVDRGPYVENFIRGNEFEAAYDLAKIGKPWTGASGI
jgi:putative endopeptidase